ncbi:MAG: hypothetical protein RR646_06950 [Erysipelotrichaceae bacterium]
MSKSILKFDALSDDDIKSIINSLPVVALSTPLFKHKIYSSAKGIAGFRPESVKAETVREIYCKEILIKRNKTGLRDKIISIVALELQSVLKSISKDISKHYDKGELLDEDKATMIAAYDPKRLHFSKAIYIKILGIGDTELIDKISNEELKKSNDKLTTENNELKTEYKNKEKKYSEEIAKLKASNSKLTKQLESVEKKLVKATNITTNSTTTIPTTSSSRKVIDNKALLNIIEQDIKSLDNNILKVCLEKQLKKDIDLNTLIHSLDELKYPTTINNNYKKFKEIIFIQYSLMILKEKK